LVRRPQLLVLDDATSSVDATVEAAILRGLREVALPSTVVLIAYRRSTIELADEVVFLAGGRIVGRGRHAELLAAVPAYAELVTAYDRAAAQRVQEAADRDVALGVDRDVAAGTR
jgi:ABC-type multidrug transport system fused ATPase/permease subunit